MPPATTTKWITMLQMHLPESLDRSEFIYDKYTCHLFNDINWSVNLDSIYDLIAAD